MSAPSKEHVERAAQLWCEPQHAHKEMDADFAMSIAQAISDAVASERGATARLFVERVGGSWPDCPNDPDWEKWSLLLHGEEAGDCLDGEEGRAWFLELRSRSERGE